MSTGTAAGTPARRQWMQVVYPDTGHMVMLEHPDRFNADLRAFIEE